jgi:hypothetical protein
MRKVFNETKTDFEGETIGRGGGAGLALMQCSDMGAIKSGHNSSESQ